MVTPLDPTSLAFLMAENRAMPMHVGGLQLFDKPEGAGRSFSREMYASLREVEEVAPLFLRRPHRSPATGGQWVWTTDELFDIDYHVRHSGLPKPGRIRELLELCSRLHSTRLARERPLWEATLIEGLRDGRVALHTKMHHALVDGVAASRLVQRTLSTDPDERDMPAPWSALNTTRKPSRELEAAHRSLAEVPVEALRTALGLSAEAAGMPAALVRTLARGIRNDTSAVSLHAPHTIFNQKITGSRRFAAQDWPIERMKAIGTSTGTTLNDVVLAMCSGALRAYLVEHGALPDRPLVAMVPVGLNATKVHQANADGGNAVGSVMVQLGTHLDDPADRLASIHSSMQDGKQALSSMTPAQIVAMTAVGLAPAILTPMLRMHNIVRPPFNVIISNVPGPKETQYFNGARLSGLYPLSIPIHGMALNITCTSYDGVMGFGVTGCRRTVPRLQRLLTHLDDELSALEKAAGV